jgi:hypothetical protein
VKGWFSLCTHCSLVSVKLGAFFFLWLTLLFNTKHDRIGFFFFVCGLALWIKSTNPTNPTSLACLPGTTSEEKKNSTFFFLVVVLCVSVCV